MKLKNRFISIIYGSVSLEVRIQDKGVNVFQYDHGPKKNTLHFFMFRYGLIEFLNIICEARMDL